ncbi:MAG: sugar ABC transporter permease [Planctomycetota bacterium]|nr:sugar ABC transporter permease [Planctomycetota bacterium]
MATLSSQTRRAPWLFLLPFLAVFATFTLYPLIRAMMLAGQQTFGPGYTKWVGGSNFAALMNDALFWTALKNTVVFTLGSVFVQLPVSLAMAMMLEAKGLRGKGVYRAILFAPSLVGVSFAAVLFALMFEKRTGLVNQGLHGATAWLSLLSGKDLAWSLDFGWLEQHVMAALIVAALWMYAGFNMLFFSAALQNIRQDIKEAATVDGAGPVARFFHVTVPAIRPVAAFVVLLSIIGSFQLFELPYLMLNGGAGPNNRGLTVVMYLYQVGFETGDLGYASAIGWTLTLILLGFTIAQRMTARGEEVAR